MLSHQQLKIFVGPPGTGKTTRLLEVVEQELSAGVPPDRIAFVTYSRKAAEEAIERAGLRFGLTREQFPYFRTLHSLAYKMTGEGRHDILGIARIREAFSKAPGIALRRAYGPDSYSEPTVGEELEHCYHLARLTCQDYGAFMKTYRPRTAITAALLDYYVRTLEAYKQASRCLDFTDLLTAFIDYGDVPRLDVVIVDEAQDLSRLQWKMVNKIIAKAKRVYVAGDDDQTIYDCFGADVETFVGLPGEVEVLKQSWRCPRRVTNLAHKIISHVSHRRPKEWRPKDEDGALRIIQEEALTFGPGQWLVLARNNYLLRSVCDRLRDRGYFFYRNGTPSLDPERLTAVRDWVAVRRGLTVPALRAVTLVQHLSTAYVSRKKAEGLAQLSTNTAVDAVTLSRHGVDLRHDWPLAFNWNVAPYKHDKEIRYYVERLLTRGVVPSDKIRVSTIHAAKGGEAENVVLFSDVSAVADRNQFEKGSKDSEHRVFYVGVTRCSGNLYLVPPKTMNFYRNLL